MKIKFNHYKYSLIVFFILLLPLFSIDVRKDTNKLNYSTYREVDDQHTSIENNINSIKGISEVNISLQSPSAGSRVRGNSSVNITFTPQPDTIIYQWDGVGNWTSLMGQVSIEVFTPLTEGSHFIIVRANDSANDWFQKSWAFTVDDTSIFFTLNEPQEYSTLKSGIDINVTFDPVPVGILYAWDSEEFSMLARPTPVGDGLHIYQIRAEDQSSTWYTISYYFYIDDTPPLVSLSETNNSVLPSYKAIVWNSSIPSDLNCVWHNWNGDPNVTNTYDETLDGYKFTVPNGSLEHILTIYTNDSINNIGIYKYQFTAKMSIQLNEYPMQIYQENDNQIYGYIRCNPNISLSFNFSDTSSIVYYNWWNVTGPTENSTVLFDTPTNPVLNTLQVFANDSLGWWYTMKLDVFLDNTSINITDSQYENKSELLRNTSIEFSFSEPYIKQVLYSWDSLDNTTSTIIPSDIGIHELNLSLQDWALNWNSYYYIYYTKYNVTILNALNNSNVIPDLLLDVNIFPTPVDTKYSWDESADTGVIENVPIESSTHTLNISTQDPNGKWYTEIFIFQTILLVSLIEPFNNTSWQTIPIELIFSDTPLTILYSWNGAPYSTLLGDTPSSDDLHILHVRVENSDLPSTVWYDYYFWILIDNTNPVILDISVTNNTRINKNTRIECTINENATITYYWDNFVDVETKECNATETVFLTTPDTLSEGLHQFWINITDSANNSDLIKYYYQIDNTPIVIILNEYINDSIIPSKTVLNITFSEIPTIEYYYIEGYTSQNQSVVPMAPYINGTIIFHVYVFDALNWNHTKYVFTVVHYLSHLKVHSPETGSLINNQAEFNITFTGERQNTFFQWNEANNDTELNIPEISGEYNLTIWMQDISGVWQSFNYQYTIDNDPPAILYINPNNTVIVGRTINFNCSEYVDCIVYKWIIHDNYTTINQINKTEFEITAPTQSGNYSLTLLLSDSLGNQGEIVLYFDIKKTEGQKFQDTIGSMINPAIIIGMIVISIVSTIIIRRKTLIN